MGFTLTAFVGLNLFIEESRLEKIADQVDQGTGSHFGLHSKRTSKVVATHLFWPKLLVYC